MVDCDCSKCEKIDCKFNPNYLDYIFLKYGYGCCLKKVKKDDERFWIFD